MMLFVSEREIQLGFFAQYNLSILFLFGLCLKLHNPNSKTKLNNFATQDNSKVYILNQYNPSKDPPLMTSK